MLRTALLLAIVLAAVPARAATGSAAPARAAPGSSPAAPASPLNPFDRPRGLRPRLDYTRAPGAQACPDELHFRAEVAAHLGREAFSEQGTWNVHVYAFRRPTGVFGVVAGLYDDKGERRADIPIREGRNCRELLIKILALEIAVYLTDPPEHSPPKPPPSPAPPAPPPSPAPPPRRADSYTFRMGVGSMAGFGVAPSVAFGVAIDAGVYWPVNNPVFDGFSLSVGYIFDPVIPGDGPGETAGSRPNYSRMLGSLAPCGHVWKLFFCALGELGRIRSEASPAVAPGLAGTFAAFGTRGGVEVPFCINGRIPRLGRSAGVTAFHTVHLE